MRKRVLEVGDARQEDRIGLIVVVRLVVDWQATQREGNGALMPVLFADLLEPKLNIPRTQGGGTYWLELQRLVAEYNACPPDWVVRLKTNEIARRRQLDKFEPILTYYLFAALHLATDRFTHANRLRALFGKAFPSPAVVDEVVRHCQECGWENLHFEALARPTAPIIEAVRVEIPSQPVGYIRELGGPAGRTYFEGETVFDVFVGDPVPMYKGTGKSGLGIEAKFTSDISEQTQYSTHRNQIIRNVEVGNARCPGFMFLLIAPKMYRVHLSRFYVYKMNEYQGDHGAEALNRDSLTNPGVDVTQQWRKRIGWLDWESIVDLIYPEGHPAFDHPDSGKLVEFLNQRLR
jgi:hypothetical protein